jgi:hypothetical protein
VRLPSAPSRKAITSVIWPWPPGKLAAVISVADDGNTVLDVLDGWPTRPVIRTFALA